MPTLPSPILEALQRVQFSEHSGDLTHSGEWSILVTIDQDSSDSRFNALLQIIHQPSHAADVYDHSSVAMFDGCPIDIVPDGQLTDSIEATLDHRGFARFQNLLPGDYSVRESVIDLVLESEIYAGETAHYSPEKVVSDIVTERATIVPIHADLENCKGLARLTLWTEDERYLSAKVRWRIGKVMGELTLAGGDGERSYASVELAASFAELEGLARWFRVI